MSYELEQEYYEWEGIITDIQFHTQEIKRF